MLSMLVLNKTNKKMNKNKITFSESCFCYIVTVTFNSKIDGLIKTYFTHIDGDIHSTCFIWNATRFFSKNEAKEVCTECKAIWPEATYTICKIYMSEPVIEED